MPSCKRFGCEAKLKDGPFCEEHAISKQPEQKPEAQASIPVAPLAPPSKHQPSLEPSKQSKGGMSRAAKLTPEERSAIAKKAAKARWGGKTQ